VIDDRQAFPPLTLSPCNTLSSLLAEKKVLAGLTERRRIRILKAETEVMP